ncbi:MAG: hypothetical protein ABID54_06790 [Pseudomonadota bacterium]
MNRYLIAVITLVVIFCGIRAEARTVTEGTLDIQTIATRISGDLKEYSEKRDTLVDNIKSVQEGIQKLKEDYAKAESEKDKIMIKANTLKETSTLLHFYSQFYNLNIQKVEAILPNLDRIKKAARKGITGKTARELRDPELKKNLNTLYGNLATFAVIIEKANVKKEIATLLRENELLYHQGGKGQDVFNDITRNIDKVTDYLKSIYARTVLRFNILQRKKFQTELAVQLMQYALVLRPIKQTLLEINPEGIMEVPDIEIGEFIDPIISDNQLEGEGEMIPSNDPDIDTALRKYQNGPNF